ncbi:MAG: AbrB/MazE/SpoVT family DNA-binding domain-containing protein [Hyphomonas sp.]|jgi:antitoxin VapB|nr:AbrB/MazE/SpoVT family DNA-binding domain-containing protein [Hyphomonas sp.]
MTVARSRTFKSGNSEAVRLPKDVAFGEGVELIIVRSGDVMTIYPAQMTVTEMLSRLRALPVPPEIEIRETEPLPERDAL